MMDVDSKISGISVHSEARPQLVSRERCKRFPTALFWQNELPFHFWWKISTLPSVINVPTQLLPSSWSSSFEEKPALAILAVRRPHTRIGFFRASPTDPEEEELAQLRLMAPLSLSQQL
jgi:hypothetical protein